MPFLIGVEQKYDPTDVFKFAQAFRSLSGGGSASPATRVPWQGGPRYHDPAMTTSTVPSRALAPDVDPVRFEVIRNALLAITEEMGATLRRAAYSTNIKTRGDFSCAFFDRDLRTIAQAFAQPSHLGSLAHIVPRAITAYGADHLAPGDGILINDPYLGGVHLNDITLITPSSTRSALRLRGEHRAPRRRGGGAPGASGCRARSTRRGWSSRRCGS